MERVFSLRSTYVQYDDHIQRATVYIIRCSTTLNKYLYFYGVLQISCRYLINGQLDFSGGLINSNLLYALPQDNELFLGQTLVEGEVKSTQDLHRLGYNIIDFHLREGKTFKFFEPVFKLLSLFFKFIQPLVNILAIGRGCCPAGCLLYRLSSLFRPRPFLLPY